MFLFSSSNTCYMSCRLFLMTSRKSLVNKMLHILHFNFISSQRYVSYCYQREIILISSFCTQCDIHCAKVSSISCDTYKRLPNNESQKSQSIKLSSTQSFQLIVIDWLLLSLKLYQHGDQYWIDKMSLELSSFSLAQRKLELYLLTLLLLGIIISEYF